MHEVEYPNQVHENWNTIFGHFKAIVDSSDDAIISKDLNGVIQTWNRGAEEIFGYTPEEAIGKPITILFPPENIDEEPAILARIRAGERIDHYETVRKRKDGQLIDISLTISPIKDASGKIIGASKIARDVTQKKRSETELRRANKKLERIDKLKDQFLAMLSHELRTPLNPILLVASSAAADSSLTSEVRADFEMILKNVEMEARIIDDLLDLARVKSGKLKLEKRPVRIHDVLAGAISQVKSQAQTKQITLVEKAGNPDSVVMGDGVRLQQVFSNILRNAVKFTPANGAVTITAESRNGQYVVKVSDTGVGMTADELAVVFEVFAQGENGQEADHCGGLGLGLAIARQFVQQHDGTIEAFSPGRGHGCAFTIKLPLAAACADHETSSVAQPAPPLGSGTHIFRESNGHRESRQRAAI